MRLLKFTLCLAIVSLGAACSSPNEDLKPSKTQDRTPTQAMIDLGTSTATEFLSSAYQAGLDKIKNAFNQYFGGIPASVSSTVSGFFNKTKAAANPNINLDALLGQLTNNGQIDLTAVVADLTAQFGNLSAADKQNVMDALSAFVAGLTSDPLKMAQITALLQQAQNASNFSLTGLKTTMFCIEAPAAFTGLKALYPLPANVDAFYNQVYAALCQ